MSNNSVLEED